MKLALYSCIIKPLNNFQIPVKNFFHTALLSVKTETYFTLLFIIIPALNFISGLNIDLYAPSLPAIATYYSVSPALVKSTIGIGMVGFAIGCVVFGSLFHIFSHRSIILGGLLGYAIMGLLALICPNIAVFFVIRFIQGFLISIMSVGARVVMVENFSGHRLNVGLLYISLAFSLGTILAPFIGGMLQYHFGWHANFLAYTVFAGLLFLAYALFISEKNFVKEKISVRQIAVNYSRVLRSRLFVAGMLMVSCAYTAAMVFPTVGGFLVETVLQRSAIAYGNAALLIGLGFLFGSLLNRLFIKTIIMLRLISIGFIMLLVFTVLQVVLAMFAPFNLFVIVLPIFLIGFALGFTNNNIMVICLRHFTGHASIVSAAFLSLQLLVASCILFVVSHIHVEGLKMLAAIFAVLSLSQIVLYYAVFKPVAKEI